MPVRTRIRAPLQPRDALQARTGPDHNPAALTVPFLQDGRHLESARTRQKLVGGAGGNGVHGVTPKCSASASKTAHGAGIVHSLRYIPSHSPAQEPADRKSVV